jgi:uncharacterized protein YqiB (DUF1249 family)
MFHVEGGVDVELLAECGQIAQRLRSLEQTWSIDLKELQRGCLCNFGSPPALTASHSVVQKLSTVYDINENTPGSEHSPEVVSRVRHLEDVAIGLYYQRELQRQALLQESDTSARRAPATMNYSVTSGSSSSNHHELVAPPPQASNGASSDEGTNSSKQSHHPHQQQQQLCDKITNDDLQLLLRELRRKIDYTEKMNWLCKLCHGNYHHIRPFFSPPPMCRLARSLLSFHLSLAFASKLLYWIRNVPALLRYNFFNVAKRTCA